MSVINITSLIIIIIIIIITFILLHHTSTSYFYIIQASEDIGDLYDLDMHPEIEDEVVDLITVIADAKEGNTTTAIDPTAATQRLFEIFIQTEDMAKYTKDFNEFAAVLGNPNTEDPFDWSQFDLQTDKDLKKLSEEMQALEEPQREEQREMSMMMKLRGDDVDDDDYDEEGKYDEEGEYDDDVDYRGQRYLTLRWALKNMN